MNARVRAVEAYIKALRTGEASASALASSFLARDVVLETTGAHMWGNGPEKFEGYDQVVPKITGIDVITGVYRGAPWTNPEPDGDSRMRVSADYGGGLVSTTSLTFTFDDSDKITHIEHINTGGGGGGAPVDKMPPFVKAIVNSALANNTPMIVAYTDENGAPVLSLRGSTQVYSDTQLSMWVRHASGGMANSIRKNPQMSLMYRDPPARATLTFVGRGHFEEDEDIRNRVFDLAPEVEQKHDLSRTGAALIIDIDRLNGNTPRGGVRMQR